MFVPNEDGADAAGGDGVGAPFEEMGSDEDDEGVGHSGGRSFSVRTGKIRAWNGAGVELVWSWCGAATE